MSHAVKHKSAYCKWEVHWGRSAFVAYTDEWSWDTQGHCAVSNIDIVAGTSG